MGRRPRDRRARGLSRVRRWGVDLREAVPRAREEVANQLAGRLLLPTAWFAADAAAGGLGPDRA